MFNLSAVRLVRLLRVCSLRRVALGLVVALAPMLPVAAAPAAASAPPASAGNAHLRDTRWTLQTLAGTPVARTGTRSTPQLVLGAGSQHLSGSGGCNRLRGRFTQRGTQLAFTAEAGTRMTCAPAVMQQEQQLLAVLAAVDGYRIEGRVLSLLQGEVVKATFSTAAGS